MEKQIKAIIVDDEQLAVDTLQWQLREFCKGIEVVATFTNPKKAIEWIENNSIQLCFLDINMPEMSGFDFINHWKSSPPFDFIFTTAYSEYAIQAFKVSAFHYLLKPIDEDDLIEAINKYQIQNHTRSSVTDQLSILLKQLETPKTYQQRIALPTLEAVHIVDVKNILRLQADNNYTTFYLDDSAKLLVSKTLKEIDTLLSPEIFLRIHQSHSINITKIKMYQRGRGGNIIMIDGTMLPVSKSKKEDLMHVLGL